MVKGTASFGKRNRTVHIPCRRCGRKSYHVTKKRCSFCGFGERLALRRYSWLARQASRR